MASSKRGRKPKKFQNKTFWRWLNACPKDQRHIMLKKVMKGAKMKLKTFVPALAKLKSKTTVVLHRLEALHPSRKTDRSNIACPPSVEKCVNQVRNVPMLPESQDRLKPTTTSARPCPSVATSALGTAHPSPAAASTSKAAGATPPRWPLVVKAAALCSPPPRSSGALAAAEAVKSQHSSLSPAAFRSSPSSERDARQTLAEGSRRSDNGVTPHAGAMLPPPTSGSGATAALARAVCDAETELRELGLRLERCLRLEPGQKRYTRTLEALQRCLLRLRERAAAVLPLHAAASTPQQEEEVLRRLHADTHLRLYTLPRLRALLTLLGRVADESKLKAHLPVMYRSYVTDVFTLQRGDKSTPASGVPVSVE